MNVRNVFSTALLLVAACAHAPADRSVLDRVFETERQFAAYTRQHGVTLGFRSYAATDAILFRPDPVNAHAFLADKPVQAGPPRLEWWPVLGLVARSGDLAFDTGPWRMSDGGAHGWFFTIWSRQQDGTWKWLLDHGIRTPSAADFPPDSPTRALAPGRAGPADDAALAEIRGIESTLSARMAAAGNGVLQDLLSEDAWIASDGEQPATGAAVAAALQRRPRLAGTEFVSGGVSRAGDLAYSYGHARWSGSGKRGHYVRVWRRGRDGWRLVFDALTPVRS